jgi:hypothetical protein
MKMKFIERKKSLYSQLRLACAESIKRACASIPDDTERAHGPFPPPGDTTVQPRPDLPE